MLESNMLGKQLIPKKITAILVYSRLFLVFGGLICAIGVMWNRNPYLYFLGVVLLLISMSFDLVDGWFSARFSPNPKLALLADRIFDKIVTSIIFPLVAVGITWRFHFNSINHSNAELLHTIFVLFLCITVLIRDNFANFMRSFALKKGHEPEPSEYTRLRTIVAAPTGAILYAYAFFVPDNINLPLYSLLSKLGHMPLSGLFFIEIIFLIISFGSIAAYWKKYGVHFMEELFLGDEVLRIKILSFFPNALTVMNAVMGILSIFFAYQGRIREAYLLLIGAALFDKLDGALARKLGLTDLPGNQITSHNLSVGGILDDIADAVSFCLAPAWIFNITLSSCSDPFIQKLPILLMTVLYVVLGFARLLYFTFDPKPIPGFFKGLPTPGAALFVIPPLIVFSQYIGESTTMLRLWGSIAFGVMALACLLMNLYFIKYLHLGRHMSRSPWFAWSTLLLLLLAVFTPYFGHVALIYLLAYVLSPFYTWRIDASTAAKESKPY